VNRKYREVILFSGGMDSFIAWEYAGRPTPYYFKMFHKYQDQEIKVLTEMWGKIEGFEPVILDLFKFTHIEDDEAYIPGRNLYLLTAAANYADKIYIGLQKGEKDIPDRTFEFIQKVSQLLTVTYGRRIIVDSPIWHLTKVDLVGWYIKKKLPIENLLATWSCYCPAEMKIGGTRDQRPCGHCSACFRRWVAFAYNSIEEEYVNDPWEGPLVEQYIMKLERGEYDKKRTEQTIRVLRKFGRM